MDGTKQIGDTHPIDFLPPPGGYRALYFDLDGTLLDPRSKLDPTTLQMLHRLMAEGIRVGIATGRMYHSAAPYIRQVGCNAPLILFNGARINRADRDEAHVQHRLGRQTARLVIERARNQHVHVNLYHEHRYFMDSDDPHGRAFIAKENFMPVMVPDLTDMLEQDPVKLLLIADPERLADVRPELERLTAGQATLVSSEPEFLEVLPAGISKGRALHEVAAIMHITVEQIVAFGDGPNDADMLEVAGLGVAMGNARESVIQAADVRTASNADRGVALALSRIFPWLEETSSPNQSDHGDARQRIEKEPR